MAASALLAGRYDLGPLIADDGVKQVYAGHDQHLGRDVTIEVVSSDDADVRARFLARAKMLAVEHHPHLVIVYDTGEDDGRVYAVLEPTTGVTLAQRFQHGPPFTITQVVELGIGLCQATAAALQRDLVVEPLGPESVLLQDGDHVKLGNLLLHPAEVQPASGALPVTSEQSLVQRIAIMLVAAMQPPGVADLNRPIARAADLPPGLPATLRTIALAAIAPRGASIRTLAELRQALSEYRGAAQLTTRAFAPLAPAGTSDLSGDGTPPPAPVTRALPGTGAVRAGATIWTGRGAGRRRSTPWFPLIAVLLIGALIAGVGATAIWLGTADGVTPANVGLAGVTPSVTPLASTAAPVIPTATPPGSPPTVTPTPGIDQQGQLGGVPATPTVGGAHATETALAGQTATAGYFATQTATAAAPVTATTIPTLTPVATLTPIPVATPSPPPSPTVTAVPTAAVPGVLGKTVADATQILSQAGFVAARTNDQPSNTVPAGIVIAQNPDAASIVPAGSTVKITASSGPPTVSVPAVTGLNILTARATLATRGFSVKVVQQPNQTVAEGIVTGQDPNPSAAALPDSTVTLTVSAGNRVAVPNVVGLAEGDAQAKIKDSGLSTDFVNHSGHDSSVQVGQVESETPFAGTLVPRGSVVRINVRSS